MQDRFVKIMLVVVACLLAANLLKPDAGGQAVVLPSILPTAHAQDNVPAPAQNYQVKSIKGFSVEDLRDIVAVGDGRSFVVSNSAGFMVYQVVPSR